MAATAWWALAGLVVTAILVAFLVCSTRATMAKGPSGRAPRRPAAPVTTVLVTNCRQNVPKTYGIARVISSLAHVPELLESGVIVFDGAVIDDGAGWIDEKCRGPCDAAKYLEYVEEVESLAQEHFKIFEPVVLPRRSCLSDTLHSAWPRVETEHVFLLQDDLVIERPFPFADILKGMRSEPRLGIVFLLVENVRYHTDWTDEVCGAHQGEREHMSVHGVDYVESFQFNDQAQLTSRKFYDEHVWDKVTSGSFMEYDIACASRFPDLRGMLWYHAKDLSSQGHLSHINGREAA